MSLGRHIERVAMVGALVCGACSPHHSSPAGSVGPPPTIVDSTGCRYDASVPATPRAHIAGASWQDRQSMDLRVDPPPSGTTPKVSPQDAWTVLMDALSLPPGDDAELILGTVRSGMPEGWSPAMDAGVAPSNLKWLTQPALAWFGVVHHVPTRGPAGGRSPPLTPQETVVGATVAPNLCPTGTSFGEVDALTGLLVFSGGGESPVLDRWIAAQPSLPSGLRFAPLPPTTETPVRNAPEPSIRSTP